MRRRYNLFVLLLRTEGKESVKENRDKKDPPVITMVFIKFFIPVIIIKFFNESSHHASA